MQTKIILLLLFFACILGFFLLVTTNIDAQGELYGLEKVTEVPVPKESPGAFVGKIIKYILGLVGAILVALIIYGGVLYATSAGNEEKVKKAKRVLTYAIVGTIIIAASFAITSYIISALEKK